MIAHVGGMPVEEALLPLASCASAGLVLGARLGSVAGATPSAELLPQPVGDERDYRIGLTGYPVTEFARRARPSTTRFPPRRSGTT